MYDLKNIDLGNDEAEQDVRLEEYFLKTSYYKNALLGRKTLVIGRKGSENLQFSYCLKKK